MNGKSIDEKAGELYEDKTSSRADDVSREEGAVETKDPKPHPLSRTQSRKSEIDPFGEPPDGGLNAWLKVLGCFLLYSNIWYAHRSIERAWNFNILPGDSPFHLVPFKPTTRSIS